MYMLRMHLCIATASLTLQIKTFLAQSVPLDLLAFCKRYDALTMNIRASFMSWWGSCRARFARSTPPQTIVASCFSLSIVCNRQQLLASTIATKHHSFRALLTHETTICTPTRPMFYKVLTWPPSLLACLGLSWALLGLS